MNILEITLKQETPMIHFEHKLENATLRATELKPKIDKFIIEDLESVNPGMYKKYKDVIKEKIKKETKSAYKINISGVTEAEDIPKYKTLYFGNENDMRTIMSTSNIIIRIFSFNSKVIKLIKDIIPYVFAYNNFGTRQNKGFGCFTPLKYEFYGDEKGEKYEFDLEKLLLDGKKTIFKSNVEFSDATKYDEIYEKIKNDYNKLKSGRRGTSKSLLMEYMYGKSIRWEKAKFKSDLKIKDINSYKKLIGHTNNEKNDKGVISDKEARYIRAMLGLAPDNIYKMEDRKRLMLKIKDGEGYIDRFKSPITFKYKDEIVYVFSNDIPGEMYDRKFEFSYSYRDRKKMEISTPTMDEFDLLDFMSFGFKKLNYEEVKK